MDPPSEQSRGADQSVYFTSGIAGHKEAGVIPPRSGVAAGVAAVARRFANFAALPAKHPAHLAGACDGGKPDNGYPPWWFRADDGNTRAEEK